MKRLNNFVVAFAATLLVAGCAAPGSHQNVNVAGYQHADDNSSSALPKVVGCSDVPGMISDGGKTTHRLTPQLQVQLEAAGYVNKLEPDGRYHWVCGRSNNQVMPPQAAAVPSPAVKVAPTPLMPPPSAAVPPTNRAAAPKPLKEKGSCPDLCSTAKAEIKEISTEVKVLVRQVGEHGVRLKKQDDQLKTHTARLKEHDGRLDKLESRVDKVEKDSDSLLVQVREHENKISVLSTQATEILSRIGEEVKNAVHEGMQKTFVDGPPAKKE